VDPAGTDVPSHPPTPRVREHSPLGWLTLGLALAASGVVATLMNTGAVHLSLAQALAVPLTIIGLGLLVGTVAGRTRWIVVLGLPLAMVVVAASAFTVPMNGVYGDRTVARDIQSSYVMSGGRLSLQLARVAPDQLPPVIDVRMGAGSVDVLLPPHGVRLDATVNVGDVHVGHSSGGFDVARSVGDPNASTVLRAHVDVGEIRARYASSLQAANGGSK
jgi:hypothetical protein